MKSEVRVISRDCTHVLPDEGLVLTGGQITSIPAEHLSRVLLLPGVEQLPHLEPDKE